MEFESKIDKMKWNSNLRSDQFNTRLLMQQRRKQRSLFRIPSGFITQRLRFTSEKNRSVLRSQSRRVFGLKEFVECNRIFRAESEAEKRMRFGVFENECVFGSEFEK